MKFFLKKIAAFFTTGLIKFFFSFNAGRYLIDKIIGVILCEKKKISHNNINLEFCSPNRMNFYRIETFSTKEPDTLNWIDDFKKEKVFWDIGANVGLYSCYAAKKIGCKVYSFEPSVFNLEILTRNININSLTDKITIVPFPLSESQSFKSFYITTKVWGGAFSNYGESKDHHGKILPKNFNYKTVGFSIDQLVEQINFERPNYIKIDVDGIEHLILKGSTNTLKDVETILIEVNENYNEQSEKVSQYLISSGFTLKQKKQIQIKENSVSLPFFYNQIWIKK
tara:strand:+ start:287 stop:1132 length:846 start_codon:yes stop_codon:yes gene_type:complete